MSNSKRIGWGLIALAAALSVGILSFEIYSLANQQNPESSETLPALEFEPAGED